jgi:hypothetical protein
MTIHLRNPNKEFAVDETPKQLQSLLEAAVWLRGDLEKRRAMVEWLETLAGIAEPVRPDREALSRARLEIASLREQLAASPDAGLAGHTAQLEASLSAAQETIRDREAEATGLQQAVAAAKTERDAARRSLAEAQHEVEAARKIHAEHKHDEGIHVEVLQLRRRLSRGLQIVDSLGTKDTPAMVDLRKVLVGP